MELNDKLTNFKNNVKMLMLQPNEKILKATCQDYVDLFIKPKLDGLNLLPMEFAISKNDNILGQYDPQDNAIKIYINKVMNSLSLGENIYAVGDLLTTVGHEYEHSFQDNFFELMENNSLANLREYNIYKKIIGNNAHAMVEELDKIDLGDSGIENLLKFNPGLFKEIKKLTDAQENEIIQLCSNALYLKFADEIDAREKGLEFLQNCADSYPKDDNFHKLLMVYISDEKEHENSLQKQFFPVADKLNDFIKNISVSDYVEFAKAMKKEKLIADQMGMLSHDYEVSYIDYFIKKEIMNSAAGFILAKNNELDYENKSKEEIKNIIQTLIKKGYPEAAVALKENEDLDYSSFKDDYFSILKNQDITQDSFAFISELTSSQKQELLCKYIDEGKTLFAQSMLFEMSPDEITAPNKSNSVLDCIENRIDALQQKVKNNTAVYDDIDDMICLLADMCQMESVPYYDKDAQFDESELKTRLYNAYKTAEKIGYEQVVKMQGYEPRPDSYRYAHASDRASYTMTGEKQQKRLIDLYGANEIELSNLYKEINPAQEKSSARELI